MRIIHYQPMGYGGLGDFLRASISLYALSKKLGYEYYIDIEQPFLKNCFQIHRYMSASEENGNHNTNKITYLSPESLQSSAYVSEETIKEFFNKLDQNATYKFISNHYGYIQTASILEEYRTSVLSPSDMTCQMMNVFYERTNLNKNPETNPKPYISLHIRCGDAHLNGSTRNEQRINTSDINSIVSTLRSYMEEQNPEHLPVVLHTDSLQLKHELFCNLPGQLLDTQAHIQHIGEYFGNFTQDTVLSTVAEFYFIMGAEKILSPFSYSGFSHIAAVIGEKPYHTMCENTNNIFGWYT